MTYTNDAATSVALNLAVSATDSGGTAPAPAGLFTLSGNQVTVPANGTAQVTVTLHQVNGTYSLYGGVLTATADIEGVPDPNKSPGSTPTHPA
ncbi:hypothetical protein ACQP2K_18245 [Microbispora siamensis]